MKKHILYILSFAVIAIITSCNKDNTNGNANSPNSKVIDYEFTTTVSGTYVMTYTGTDGNNLFEQFTGTKWSKILTINDTKVTKVCTLTASCPSVTTNAPVNFTILFNGGIVSGAAPTFTTASYTASINYTF